MTGLINMELPWLVILPAFASGLGAGFAYFLTLKAVVRILLSPAPGAGAAIIHAGRFFGLIAFLLAVVQFGAPALLASFAGLLVARQIIKWRLAPC